MIVHNVKQGTDEWIQARLGIPTASRFGEIITPTGKPSASARRYMAELLAEWWNGAPINDYQSPLMARGNGLEPKAAAWYELATGSEAVKAAFYTLDDGSAGASPDFLVGDDGLLEVKCLGLNNHVLAIIDKEPVSDHFVQVQGQLWITGREWADLLFYNPHLPCRTVRIERDDDFIAKVSERVAVFADEMRRAREILRPSAAKEADDAPACLA